MKSGYRIVLGVVILALLTAAPAVSQDRGPNFGFFAAVDKYSDYTPLSYDESISVGAYRIGLMIEPTPSFLIKPDITLKTLKMAVDDKLNDNTYDSFEYNSAGGGVSVFYRITSYERTSLYLGPRFEYKWAGQTEWYSDGEKETEDYYNSWAVMACVAGQYSFSTHFRCFAEIGFGYGSLKSEEKRWNMAGDVSTNKTTTSPGFMAYGGQLGVAFYF
jgi:hypothetical protein